MRGAGCVACCCVMTQDRIFMCHEDVQTNAVRTLGSLSIALLNAVFVDAGNNTCCVLVSDVSINRNINHSPLTEVKTVTTMKTTTRQRNQKF